MADFNFFLNRQGPKGAQGKKGNTGFSPTIAPSADNDGLTTYKLVITNENNTYETDNLMGNLDIVDDGGTYLRYNRENGSVSASEADTATASAAGVVRLANSTDYANLADDAVMTPSSFVDNYNNIFTAGYGVNLDQNIDDTIVISIDDSTIVTEMDLESALTPYATKSMLSDYVSDYDFNSTLANYVTNSALSSTLANYVTNSSLSSTLASYVTSSALGTTLSDYVTDSELSSALNPYVTNTSLATTLSNYMTLGTEQTVTATKRFEAEQFIGAFHIGNTYQHRISSIGENLILISRASSTGDATENSTILYMGSGSFAVSRGPSGTSYSLIDTSTGLIPDARLSSNIARTSQIPDISTKQDTLVSGTNIKTINNQSLLGSGNIDIQGGGSTYTAGTGISINANNEIGIIQEGTSTVVTSYTWDLTSVGSPTITDGVVTGFSKSKYLKTKTNPNNTVTSFEMFFDFITPSDVQTYGALIGQADPFVNMTTPQIVIDSGRIVVYLSATGSSWDCVLRSSANIVAGRAYTLKVEWLSSNNTVSAVLTDKTTGTPENLTVSSGSDILSRLSWSTLLCIGLDGYSGGTDYTGTFSNGYINLNNSYIKVNGVLFNDITANTSPDISDVAVATNSLFGLVKPDNSTIIVNDGVISLNPTILGSIETALHTINSGV